MKLLKEYKGIVIIYLIITIVNIIWFTSYEKPAIKNVKADDTKTIAMINKYN